VTQSSVELIRNDREISLMSFRRFLNKLRTFAKLLVGERGAIGHDVHGRYVIWQLTTLVNHYDLFALGHTAQISSLFQYAVSRGPRVEYIAANIRFLYVCSLITALGNKSLVTNCCWGKISLFLLISKRWARIWQWKLEIGYGFWEIRKGLLYI
jgi:hypothetical protein